ncbi:MAG: CRISPR-associated protein Csx3 [bacterium]|nr:CRISPR-associated protein Csx3 [bacterium]
MTTLVHAVYPVAVKIRDPKVEGDYVKIPFLKMASEGSDHLKWKIEDKENYTFMEFSISCHSGVFVVSDLSDVIVPEVSQEKGIVISGKGPNWLVVAIVMAYRNAAWIALFRPQEHGAIVVVRRNTPHAPQLGEVIRDIYLTGA